MPKRSSKEQDVNDLAATALRRTLELAGEPADAGKDPIAVLLGRRGGLKGGRARMDSLNANERSALATKAARARWGTAKRKSTNRKK